MRTKILKYFGMVVVLIIMVNLTSCEVSIESWYDDDDYSEIYYIVAISGNKFAQRSSRAMYDIDRFTRAIFADYFYIGLDSLMRAAT